MSNDDNESSNEEERYLKIQVQNTKQSFEIPLEEDGSLSAFDLQLLLPGMDVLIVEFESIRRSLKPKNGCFNEPIEGWENVRVFVAANNDQKENNNVSIHNISIPSTSNCDTSLFFDLNESQRTASTSTTGENTTKTPSNTNPKKDVPSPSSLRPPCSSQQSFIDLTEIETPSASPTEDQERPPPPSIQSSLSSHLPYQNLSNENLINQIEASPTKTLASSSTTEYQNGHETPLPPSIQSSLSSSLPQQQQSITVENLINQIETSTTTETPNIDDMEDCEIIFASSSHSSVKYIPTVIPKMPDTEPTMKDVCAAYNVSSVIDLITVLYRGDTTNIYDSCYHFVTKYFKKTMVAYPNKEILRLFYFAMNYSLLFKEIDPNAPIQCEFCRCQLTLSHLFSSSRHINRYKATYNKEPPEILALLDPRNYSLYIDAENLRKLQFGSYKKIEESLEFTKISKNVNVSNFIQLKYRLIKRIIDAKLKIFKEETFSLDKIFFLRAHTDHPCLPHIFNDFQKPYNCERCEKSMSNFADMLGHILNKDHIKMHLTQTELDKICIALSYIKEDSENGYTFSLPKYRMNWMGKRYAVTSPPKVKNAKRIKNE